MDDTIFPRIRSCLAGESAGWEWVASILLKKLRHHHPSLPFDVHEDLVQTICEKLLTGFRTFRGTTEYELLDYLRTAAVREGISFRRRTVRSRDMVSLDNPRDEGENGSDLHDLLPDSGLGPDQIAELNDLYRNAAELLPLRDRQILISPLEPWLSVTIAPRRFSGRRLFCYSSFFLKENYRWWRHE
jgi:DNA-directed RNA polymerase specialized sigma24 family protein